MHTSVMWVVALYCKSASLSQGAMGAAGVNEGIPYPLRVFHATARHLQLALATTLGLGYAVTATLA